MEYKEIKKLMDDMGNSKLTEIEIEFPEGIKISMKKDCDKQVVSVPVQEVTIPQIQTQTPKVENVKEEVKGNIIKSPMVGTFYSKPNPDSKEFVKVGDKVKKGQTLCIIEAMKLMNEIESEFDGEIKEILVRNEEMVDFGKPLFVIK